MRLLARRPRPRHSRQGLLGDATVTVADVAGDRAHHLTEGRTGHRLQLTRAAAALAGLDRRTRLGAVAVAVLAALDRVKGDLDGGALCGLPQIDRYRDRDIAPRRRAPRAPTKGAGAAEEGVEEIPDRAESVEVGRVAPGAQPLMSIAVIRRPPLRVGENLVGLRGLLELLLGLRVVRVDVGMQLPREPTEGLLDLLLGGVAREAENLVRIAWHRDIAHKPTRRV